MVSSAKSELGDLPEAIFKIFYVRILQCCTLWIYDVLAIDINSSDVPVA